MSFLSKFLENVLELFMLIVLGLNQKQKGC